MNEKHVVSIEENGTRHPKALFSSEQDATSWKGQFARSADRTAVIDAVRPTERSPYDADRYCVAPSKHGAASTTSLLIKLDEQVGWRWRKAWTSYTERGRVMSDCPLAVWQMGATHETGEMAPADKTHRLSHDQYAYDGEKISVASFVSANHAREMLTDAAKDATKLRAWEHRYD